MPVAEVDVTAELVRSLLAEQLPELADEPITLLANGWDNALYRVGADLVARLPRREVSVPLVDHEATWLPELAARIRCAGRRASLDRWASSFLRCTGRRRTVIPSIPTAAVRSRTVTRSRVNG